MSRATSTTSTATTTTTTTTTSGHARTMSVKTNSAKPPALNPMPAPDVKLFVTNLRLLEFDLRDDWPDITVQTLSAKNADQRQRIAGTEWALFRLFEIWDPNETAQKLQPFFPPLEPLQSLNLRAALYRCLNELKKNGILGRESVLRKTMLDECKGEKFYEVIAIFSNAVLKKVLVARDQSERNAAVARSLAMASMLPADQQRSLLPLAIAHKAALLNVLKKKEEKRRKYLEFEGLLDKKAEDINRRIRKSKETPRAKKPVVPQKEADAVKKQLKDNWIGNQQWLDVMLHGDDVQAEDAFLDNRFDKVWHMVEKGQKLQDVAPQTGLLENLQSRVKEQQDRLQKWKAFHEELKSESSATGTSADGKHVAPVKELKFDVHSQYQLPSSNQQVEVTSIKRPELRAEYRDILSDMDEDLLRAGKVKANPISTIIPRRRALSTKEQRSPPRSRKMTLTESVPASPTSPIVPPKPKHLSRPNSLQKVPILPRPSQHVLAATPVDSEATLVGRNSTLRNAAPTTHHVDSPAQTQYEDKSAPVSAPPTPGAVDQTPRSPENRTTVTLALQEASPSPKASPRRLGSASPEYRSGPPVPNFEPPVLDPEEVLADQIINSIGNATPSPVKKPQPQMSLSLLERTRMTMSRTNSFEPVPESPDPLPSMAPLSIPPSEDPDRHATLLERTRQSMAASQSMPRRTTSKKEKRVSSGGSHSSRHSLFPVNQFDTPRSRKSFESLEEKRSESIERTPTEHLFSDEVDYDRVFKSRPRIATSPIWSPDGRGGVEGEDPDGVTGIDLADVDASDDEEEGSWMESPSRKRGFR
ncbi:HAUS augmin-like complex subunit 6 N-terminus-like protein [Stemphylium lycopersici]|nr:HAUS augmin-like complex subunit 6 N-terminus-like protein [Stemphylium lycopersici]